MCPVEVTSDKPLDIFDFNARWKRQGNNAVCVEPSTRLEPGTPFTIYWGGGIRVLENGIITTISILPFDDYFNHKPSIELLSASQTLNILRIPSIVLGVPTSYGLTQLASATVALKDLLKDAFVETGSGKRINIKMIPKTVSSTRR